MALSSSIKKETRLSGSYGRFLHSIQNKRVFIWNYGGRWYGSRTVQELRAQGWIWSIAYEPHISATHSLAQDWWLLIRAITLMRFDGIFSEQCLGSTLGHPVQEFAKNGTLATEGGAWHTQHHVFE